MCLAVGLYKVTQPLIPDLFPVSPWKQPVGVPTATTGLFSVLRSSDHQKYQDDGFVCEIQSGIKTLGIQPLLYCSTAQISPRKPLRSVHATF